MAASTPLPKSVGLGQDWGPGRWGVVGWAAGEEEGKIDRKRLQDRDRDRDRKTLGKTQRQIVCEPFVGGRLLQHQIADKFADLCGILNRKTADKTCLCI